MGIFTEKQAVVAHIFNDSALEANTGGFLSSRPAWSKEWVPWQSGLHTETLWGKKKEATFVCRCPAKDLCRPSSFCFSQFMLALLKWNRGLCSSFILSALTVSCPHIFHSSLMYEWVCVGRWMNTHHIGLCVSCSVSVFVSLFLSLSLSLSLCLSDSVSVSVSLSLYPHNILVWNSIYIPICCRRKPFL